ncbi:MAG: FkbM family methyltransferase [Syntrophothermus sp.]
MNDITELFQQKDYSAEAFYLSRKFKDKKIIVYGAGESFHYFKEIVIRKYGYLPAAIVDRKFRPGDCFEGIPAFHPDHYFPSDETLAAGIVVICLGRQSYYGQIADYMKSIGFKEIISLMDIYEIHNPFNIPPELDSEGFQYFIKNKEKIEFAYKLFADDKSREVFYNCLKTHMSRIPVQIPMDPREEQYTPSDITLRKGYSRYIYCGVSVGEMASVFSRIGKVKELVCFEPDPNQFGLTAAHLRENHHIIADRVTALPCAVYNRESVEEFIFSDTSFGSRIIPGGNHSVQCVSIDNVIPDFDPTFISMDIEGTELYALYGAEKTLRKNRPDIAVCVYHSPAHLWEISDYLNSLDLGYNFYLRNYTSFVGETVLYAVAS